MTINNYKDFLEHLSTIERSVAPKELFHEGDFSLLTSGVRVSVVGSRDVSDIGRKRTELISCELVKRDITVVSGLAEGVDTIAHTSALKCNGKTIAVLGTPLDKCTPVSNKELLGEIKKNHLAISQFPIGTPVYNSNFPTRNKTMALISDATIIVEATEKSGTRHQAWEAIRLNKTVFIMESIYNNPELSWPKEAVKYGAIVLTSTNYSDIFDALSNHYFSPVSQ